MTYTNRLIKKMLSAFKPLANRAYQSNLKQHLLAQYKPSTAPQFATPRFVKPALSIALVSVTLITVFWLNPNPKKSLESGTVVTESFIAEAASQYRDRLQNHILYLNVEWRPGKDIERYNELMGSTKGSHTGWNELSWTSIADDAHLSTRDMLDTMAYNYVNLQTHVSAEAKYYIGTLPKDSAPTTSAEVITDLLQLPLEDVSAEVGVGPCLDCLTIDIADIQTLGVADDAKLIGEETLDGRKVVHYQRYTNLPPNQAVERNYYFDKDTKQLLKQTNYDIIDGEHLETLVKTVRDEQWLDREQYSRLFDQY